MSGFKDALGDVPYVPPQRAFDGRTYEWRRDHVRLDKQLGRVFQFMQDGHWHTLAEIMLTVNGSEAAISARIRDLRKPKYGSHTVERKSLGGGLFAYRLVTVKGSAT
jgi:hypothetical protein